MSPTIDSSVRRFRHQSICLVLLLLWTATCLIIWRLLGGGIQMQQFKPSNPRPFSLNSSGRNTQTNALFIITVHDMGISQEEWDRLQKVLDWPSPDREITQLDLSTSPVHTTFSIAGLNETYKVGEKIHVTITARDHNKNLKPYGGDFFQAKLFNSELKASVYGDVVDHHNGTYTVELLLPWEGQAQVSVRLAHSSEVVQILKKYRESSFSRSHYNGHFEGPGPKGARISEIVECNLKWGPDGNWIKGNCCCEYKDVKTGTVWQCERPKTLSCDKWVYHSKGAVKSPLNTFENQLFTRKLTNVGITGVKEIINVLPNDAGIGLFRCQKTNIMEIKYSYNTGQTIYIITACIPFKLNIVYFCVSGKPERCRPGMTTPVPAGFYFKDVWKSFVCNTQTFSPLQMGKCLANKIVYIIGDSTTRQWFEYLERKVPDMKRMDLHTPRAGGPMMMIEMKNNIIIHWRAHGVPLRFSKMPITNLHYISNDIDAIAGGRHAVVVLTFFAHQVFHPLTFYVHEVAKIRQAVLALLSRAPETTVIIKSGNTAHFKDILQSDWFTMQFNTVMKEMFSDIDGVIYLDVWQMTSCHYLPEDIHPAPVIIDNEVNMLLSYVCPS